jgi:hypothetical protein
MTDPIAHLDWQQIRCQCEQHSDGCKSNCPNPATVQVQFHALDHCNTHSCDPDVDENGNYLFLLCLGCLATLTYAVNRHLQTIHDTGQTYCLTCGQPAVTWHHIIRKTQPIEAPHA